VQASASQEPWFVLGLCLQQGIRENMAWSKPIDFYALSCGSFRKPACNLIETAQRKSHPLEGSSQEAIPRPSTTFDSSPVVFCSAHSPPIGSLRRIRVFMLVASAPMRRTSHPSGSRPRDVSLFRQTSTPGICDAPENPRFPAVSNRIQRTDHMAPSRVQLLSGSRQRRRTIGPFGGGPSVKG
jgi:hypothetical protein